jgi:hypothetical protein
MSRELSGRNNLACIRSPIQPVNETNKIKRHRWMLHHSSKHNKNGAIHPCRENLGRPVLSRLEEHLADAYIELSHLYKMPGTRLAIIDS